MNHANKSSAVSKPESSEWFNNKSHHPPPPQYEVTTCIVLLEILTAASQTIRLEFPFCTATGRQSFNAKTWQ